MPFAVRPINSLPSLNTGSLLSPQYPSDRQLFRSILLEKDAYINARPPETLFTNLLATTNVLSD